MLMYSTNFWADSGIGCPELMQVCTVCSTKAMFVLTKEKSCIEIFMIDLKPPLNGLILRRSQLSFRISSKLSLCFTVSKGGSKLTILATNSYDSSCTNYLPKSLPLYFPRCLLPFCTGTQNSLLQDLGLS